MTAPATITVETYDGLKQAFAGPEAGRAREVIRILRDAGLLENRAVVPRRAWYKGRTPVTILRAESAVYDERQRVLVEFHDGTIFTLKADALTLDDPPATMTADKTTP